MILLLNYMLWLVTLFCICIVLMWPKPSYKVLVLSIIAVLAAWFVHAALLPSYLPKGEAVNRIENPAFEASNAEVKDNLLKPISEEEQDKRLEQKVDWRKRAEESKTED